MSPDIFHLEILADLPEKRVGGKEERANGEKRENLKGGKRWKFKFLTLNKL